MRAEGETGVLFQKNAEVRVANILFARGNAAEAAALSVVDAQSASVTGCDIVTTPATMAAMFQEIRGDCRVAQNRFVGRVSFYGESKDVPTPDQLGKLAAIKEVALAPSEGQLTFCNNDLSQLVVATAMIQELISTGKTSGVFVSAILHGNTFRELNSVFAPGLLGFATNAFIAVTQDANPYGVMLANRVTAVGNLASVFSNRTRLQFVAPSASQFREGCQRGLCPTLATPEPCRAPCDEHTAARCPLRRLLRPPSGRDRRGVRLRRFIEAASPAGALRDDRRERCRAAIHA